MKHIQGRPWDSFDAYLFDIDGTLIHCTDATHYFAFLHALEGLSGREGITLEGVVAHGNVDAGILRDALTRAGVAEDQWRPRVPEALATMGDFVEKRKGELCVTVLPQVREVLQHLRGRGAKLGVATGNVERIGKLKLERAGLLDFFDFAGWSDGHEHRADVFRHAVTRARELCRPDATLCVLGDTPADVLAAHQNGLPVIAVATGIFPLDQLNGEEPELCLASFEELLAPAGQPSA